MDYQVKYKNFIKGFSIAEMIIVIAILALMIVVSISVYSNFQSHNNLEIATYSVVEAIRHAKSNTEQVNGDSRWGVNISSGDVTVFKGDSYSTRDTSSDQKLSLPNGITVSGLSEVVFEKVTGVALTVGTTTLSRDGVNKDIYINAKGTITY